LDPEVVSQIKFPLFVTRLLSCNSIVLFAAFAALLYYLFDCFITCGKWSACVGFLFAIVMIAIEIVMMAVGGSALKNFGAGFYFTVYVLPLFVLVFFGVGRNIPNMEEGGSEEDYYRSILAKQIEEKHGYGYGYAQPQR
jgi:hypothetical protein